MAKQTFTTGQVLTAAQVNSLQTNDFNQTVSAKTASYVLVAADKGTRIEFNTSGSVTCTVNTGIFDAGDTLIVQNRGAGAVTITAGTATVNTSGSLVVNQYESGTLYFISASAALWFGSNPGDITGITTGASSGLTGGVTSGTADLKLNTAAKGDLLVGTGAGTVSALSVGNNGETLVADSSTSTGLRYQSGYNGNAWINGGFDIWQRGTSIASTASPAAGTYTADRFRINQIVGKTVTRQSSGLTGIQYCARVQRDSGGTSTSAINFGSDLETADSLRFAGQTVTFSLYARAGANYSSASSALTINLISGTGTDQNSFQGFTNSTIIINQTATLTTSWQRFTYTVAVASNVTQLGVQIYYTPSGTAGANDYFEITGVQLELGSVATAFKRAGGTLAGELAACQRYFQTYGGNSTRELMSTGMVFTATRGYLPTPFTGRMRTSPTVTFSNVAHFSMQEAASNWPGTSFTLENAGPTSAWLDFTASTAAMTGGRALIFYGNSTSARLELSAEL